MEITKHQFAATPFYRGVREPFCMVLPVDKKTVGQRPLNLASTISTVPTQARVNLSFVDNDEDTRATAMIHRASTSSLLIFVRGNGTRNGINVLYPRCLRCIHACYRVNCITTTNHDIDSNRNHYTNIQRHNLSPQR